MRVMVEIDAIHYLGVAMPAHVFDANLIRRDKKGLSTLFSAVPGLVISVFGNRDSFDGETLQLCIGLASLVEQCFGVHGGIVLRPRHSVLCSPPMLVKSSYRNVGTSC